MNAIPGGDRLLFYTLVCPAQPRPDPAELRTGRILCSAEWLLFVFSSAWFSVSDYLLVIMLINQTTSRQNKNKLMGRPSFRPPRPPAPSPLLTDSLLFFPPPSPRNNTGLIYKTASTVSSWGWLVQNGLSCSMWWLTFQEASLGSCNWRLGGLQETPQKCTKTKSRED